MEIYKHPRYYDIGFGWDPAKETDFLEACFKHYGPANTKRVLECGCGTARLLIELARRGYESVGVEISRPMAEYALARAHRAGVKLEILESDMSNFTMEKPADAAFCAIDTFRYLLTETLAVNNLSSVAKSLRPGGIYVLDLTLVGLLSSYPKPAEEWTIERENVSVSVSHRIIGLPDLQDRRSVEHTTLTVVEGGSTKKIETEDPMRTYTKDQFEALIETENHFKPVAWYDPDFNIDRQEEPTPSTGRMVVVLKKTANLPDPVASINPVMHRGARSFVHRSFTKRAIHMMGCTRLMQRTKGCLYHFFNSRPVSAISPLMALPSSWSPW